MKYIRILILMFGITFSNCNQKNKSTTTENKIGQLETLAKSKDKEEIQNLIRQVLNWADSKNHIDLLPVVTDSEDSIYLGFDLDKHRQNIENLITM